MRIRRTLTVAVRGGVCTDDQAAIRAGRARDGRVGVGGTPSGEVRHEPDSIVARPREVAPVVQDSAVAGPIRKRQ